MAGRGRRFTFHGAYTRKTQARRKEHSVRGFIRRAIIGGHLRYVVLKRKRRR